MHTYRKAGLLTLLAFALLAITSYVDVMETDAAIGSLYWGAHLYGRPPETSAFQPGGFVSNFETNIAQKKMSIIAWGAPWEYPTGTMLPFQKTYFDNVRNHGSIPLLDWSSMAPGGPNQPKYKLSNITRGDFDAFITQWAKDAKAWGHPFFIRFDWEMNGNWQFPWSVQLNGNTPTDYILMWRHVLNIFAVVGAYNVNWIWAPNISTWNTVPMNQVYPGAMYVDWVGLDGYNWAGYHSMPWQYLPDILSGDPRISNSHDSYTEITTLAPGKPLMLTEFATVEGGEGGSAKAEWIKEALTNSTIVRYTAIKAIVWFNWDAGAGLSWPVESSAASKSAFAWGINAPFYLSNVFNNLAGVKIPARR